MVYKVCVGTPWDLPGKLNTVSPRIVIHIGHRTVKLPQVTAVMTANIHLDSPENLAGAGKPKAFSAFSIQKRDKPFLEGVCTHFIVFKWYTKI